MFGSHSSKTSNAGDSHNGDHAHDSDHDAKHPLHDHGEEPDEFEASAGHVAHHCTDVLCLLFFFAACGGLGWIFMYSQERGDMRRLYHGFDMTGALCGVDEGFEDKPYLYWCAKPSAVQIPNSNPASSVPAYKSNLTALDLERPICVAQCPTTDATANQCYEGRTTSSGARDAVGSFTVQVKYTYKLVQDYPSYVFGHRYCFPSGNTELMAPLMAKLHSSPHTRWVMSASEIGESWVPLLIAGILAFILGYAYLFILKIAAGCLVYCCMAILVTAPLGIGAYLVYVSQNGGVDGVPTTGDSTYDLIIGVTCIIVSLLFAAIVCCTHGTIKTAIGCVEGACECMFDMPSILLEPLFTILVKGFWMTIMTIGFLSLISCGTVQRTNITSQLSGGAMDIGGLTRKFTYEDNEYYMMAYYVFMIFWVLEISTALAQFCIAYAVQLWYFTPYENDVKHDLPCFPLCRGYRIGLMYHLGSIAFGAFIVATCRVVRMILHEVAKQAKSQGNAAVACMAKCCECAVTCFQRFIEFLNKNAYMDIAINSTTFCTAAYRAFTTIVTNLGAVAVLNGACFIFQLAGVGAITSAGVYLVWLIVTKMSTFSDVASEHYVSDPIVVAGVAGVICFIVAVGFMIVFDTVADTILYCWAVDKQRKAKGINVGINFAPHRLHSLVQDHSGHDDH